MAGAFTFTDKEHIGAFDKVALNTKTEEAFA
ncbi:unnamed protein product, partial [marine sediment metagenome]